MRSMFRGVTTAMVTPFTSSGAIDFDSYGRLIEDQIRRGVRALVPCGSTGEAATLSHDEHIEIFRFVVRQVNRRVPVLAGTGSNNTAEAIHLSRAAQDAGADAVLIIAPYYNKPTQAGLLNHFRMIADAISIPMMLYDIPGRTQVKIETATTVALAQHPRIRGMKDATGSLDNTSRLRRATPQDFGVFSGDDSLTLPMLAVGADGVISVASHLIPEALNAMLSAFQNGEVARARDLHLEYLDLMHGIFVETNPAPIKYCLMRCGLIAIDTMRPPLAPLLPESRAKLDALLVQYKLI